jgi:ABC-type nitrate/sulfonate/bicarbonate transport system substrate-binding protein
MKLIQLIVFLATLFVSQFLPTPKSCAASCTAPAASPSHLPIWVAKDAGLFEKAGMNVEPVQIRGGSLITLAIITGDLPFSGAGAESVVAARARAAT